MGDKILFVDDEPATLESFKRLLHGKYDIRTAISGGEGLVRIQKDGPFAVVISDMRMPGMNGADFLAEVRRCAPDSVRMLLTGHADMHDAIDAVNRGKILHFLTKPCPRDVLVAAISSGLDQYHSALEEKGLIQKARAVERSRIDWDAADPGRGDDFESPAGLAGPKDARACLAPLMGKDAQHYIVLFRLPVLRTVEHRYGENGALEYLRIAAGYLQQSLRAGDRLFHWRRDVLMAVLERSIAPSAVHMEIERLIADTRSYVIEVQGRRTMIACLITFDLLAASQFADYDALIEMCNTRLASRPQEPAGTP
ncbi:MAG TPA: response regulator [Acidobacteriaceae bacterium]|nr:response regulator [Acidobacteriaceae bacterium]